MGIFPPGAIWRIWRAWIIEWNLHTHTHTQYSSRLLVGEPWGSASLPMWRSYILNQIHVCFMCVCRLAPVAPQHTKYLPFSFVTELLWSPTVLLKNKMNKIRNAVLLKINYLAALRCKMHVVIMIFTLFSGLNRSYILLSRPYSTINYSCYDKRRQLG